MSLKDKLATIREGSKDRIPAESRAVMHRATEDLQNSGILDRVISPGRNLPNFALHNTQGDTVYSKDLLQQGPVVLSIYRGVW